MSIAGQKTPTITPVSLADDVLVNAGGSTARLPMQKLAVQLANTPEISALGDAKQLYPTRADLPAASGQNVSFSAVVFQDPDGDNNGTWTVQLVEGVKTWVWAYGLRQNQIVATDVGAGTANAIKATTRQAVVDETTVIMNVFRTNTGSPVTVQFNDQAPLTLKTISGLDPAAGALSGGSSFMAIVRGGEVQMLSDQAVATLLYQARDTALAKAAEAGASAAAALASEGEAATSRDVAANAKDSAVAASEASGAARFFDTRSEANSALGSILDLQVIEVFEDETVNGLNTRYRKEGGSLVLKRVSAQREIFVERFSGGSDTARWQAAINFAASRGGGTVVGSRRSYELTNLLCSASNVILDFNGAEILADPTTTGSNGSPMIYFSGQYGSKRASNGPAEGALSVTVAGFGGEFSVGDYILVGDDQSVPAWDFGLTPTPGFGYTGRWEPNQVKAISGDTITLAFKTSRDYNGTGPYVRKCTPVINCGVKNIGRVVEVDPGTSNPDVDAAAPHLISFDGAVFPYVENVHADGFALHMAHFKNCWNPMLARSSARNAFRPSVGGQGYLARFQRCRNGIALANLGVRVRHGLSDVQSIGTITEKNIGIDNNSYWVGCHGHDAVDFTSIDDSSEGAYAPFAVGNGSFSKDRRSTFIRPRYRGTDVSAVVSAGAEDTTFIDPDFLAGARCFQITSGSKRTVIRGGRIKCGGNNEVIRVRNELLIASGYGVRCTDVSIIDANIDAETMATNPILNLDCDGVVEIRENSFAKTGGASEVIRLGGSASLTDLVIERNKVMSGGHNRFLLTQSAPSRRYEIIGNRDTVAAANSSVIAAANLSLDENIGAFGFVLTGTPSLLDDGAFYGRNVPFQNGFRQYNRELFKMLDELRSKAIHIAGKTGQNREITFSTQTSIADMRYDQASARFVFRLNSDDTEFQMLARNDDGSALRTQMRVTRASGLTRFGGPVSGAGYTLATLPPAADYAGGLVYVTDRTNRPAYSNGSSWRWVSDDTAVS